jgi:hypothetical protein
MRLFLLQDGPHVAQKSSWLSQAKTHQDVQDMGSCSVMRQGRRARLAKAFAKAQAQELRVTPPG